MSSNSQPPRPQLNLSTLLWVLFQVVATLVFVYATLLPGHSRHVAALFFTGMALVCHRDRWFAASYVWAMGAILAFALFVAGN